jgi:DNA-binding MarR family transcriptional regulator
MVRSNVSQADQKSPAASRRRAPRPAATVADAERLSPVASVWHAFLLRKAAQQVTALSEVVLGPLGITLRHFGVLNQIAAEPGLNQRVIGDRLRIDRTTVVSVIDDLEHARLVTRRRGADRRTFSLYLTDLGTTRLDELTDMIAEVHAEFLAPLSAAERAMLHDLLLKLTTG